MKFYVVDNGSKHVDEIVARVVAMGHSAVVDKHVPQKRLDPVDADYIILSGGMQNEVVDQYFDGTPWFANEFELIRTTDKPILGICLGLQMIVAALGGTLKTLPEMVNENKHLQLDAHSTQLLGFTEITVKEAHRWVADNLSKTDLEVLISSDDGVELIKANNKPIVATQFHPEVDVDGFNSFELFSKLIEINSMQRVG